MKATATKIEPPKYQEIFDQALAHYLALACPKDFAYEMYSYAVLPAGKLFRPSLALAMALDKGLDATTIHRDHPLIKACCALEIHHAYTLVHDDLPCMDDDDIRRGRPSHHKKFNEWMAVLSGDGLLNLSYGLLADLPPQALPHYLKYFSHCLGPKGLIHGQVLDLKGANQSHSMAHWARIHQLKTSRLIQVSLILGQIFATTRPSFNELKLTHRFGANLGLVFQFVDDLIELAEDQVQGHELEINPWIISPDRTLAFTLSKLEKVIEELGQSQYLKGVIDQYFIKMKLIIDSGEERIQSFMPDQRKLEIKPLVALLDLSGQ